MQATLTGSDLARVAYNSLLWIPKTTKWNCGYILLTRFGVTFLAYDNYNVNLSKSDADVSGDAFPSVVKISREDIVKLEALARKELKNFVRLNFEPGRALTYSGDEDDLVMIDSYEEGDIEESQDDIALQLFIDLLDERREQPDSHRFMLNPSILRKFSQTKKSDPDEGADFWIHREDPVFVRIGENSQTVMMPIDRNRHAEAIGDDTLWK